MNFWSLFVNFFSIVANNKNRFIKNGDLKICKNCKHFLEGTYATAQIGKCGKFGTMDLVDGEIYHYYADMCRNDEGLCGHNGTWFVPKINISEMRRHMMINMLLE